jgi:hypothetical protein
MRDISLKIQNILVYKLVYNSLICMYTYVDSTVFQLTKALLLAALIYICLQYSQICLRYGNNDVQLNYYV